MDKHTQSLHADDIGIKSVDEEKRIIWHRITKETIDRMGDIVRIDGLDLKKFKKKPAVLYGHDYAGKDPIPIVGKNIGFKVEGKSLYAGTQFLAADDMSDKVQDLVNDTFALMKMKLMGWSIGFMAKRVEDLKDKEGHWTGYDFKESELLEYSAVVIPAHQDAINDAITQGLVSKSFALPEPEPEEDPPVDPDEDTAELPGDVATSRIEDADEEPETPAEDLAADDPLNDPEPEPEPEPETKDKDDEPGLDPDEIKSLLARSEKANEAIREKIKRYKSLLERLGRNSKRRKTT